MIQKKIKKYKALLNNLIEGFNFQLNRKRVNIDE